MPRINIGIVIGKTKKNRNYKNIQNILVIKRRGDTDSIFLHRVINYITKNYPGYSLQGFCNTNKRILNEGDSK